jgi:hypothetical protein
MDVYGQLHAPTVRTHSTHRRGGWIRLRADLDVMAKGSILVPVGNRTLVLYEGLSKSSQTDWITK